MTLILPEGDYRKMFSSEDVIGVFGTQLNVNPAADVFFYYELMHAEKRQVHHLKCHVFFSEESPLYGSHSSAIQTKGKT